MIEMKDHIAIVTGGGSGIGRAVCLRLAKDGIPVVVQDLNDANATKVAEEVRAAGAKAEEIGRAHV